MATYRRITMPYRDFNFGGCSPIHFVERIQRNGFKIKDKLLEFVRKHTPVSPGVFNPNDEGVMKNTVSVWNFTISSRSIRFQVGWNRSTWPFKTFYPAFLIHGTGMYAESNPHLIYPIKAPVLAFKNYGGEHVGTKTSIGQKANPFLDDAIDEFFRWFDGYVYDHFKEWYREFPRLIRKKEY